MQVMRCLRARADSCVHISGGATATHKHNLICTHSTKANKITTELHYFSRSQYRIFSKIKKLLLHPKPLSKQETLKQRSLLRRELSKCHHHRPLTPQTSEGRLRVESLRARNKCTNIHVMCVCVYVYVCIYIYMPVATDV